MGGRIYEVYVNGKPIKLIGSTTRTLEQRRAKGYTKRFGPSVELRLIREINRPENYSDRDYNFYLKACETMDIVRNKTFTKDGGLNKISPLIQAHGHSLLDAEIGRLGGLRRYELYGNLATPEGCAKGGRAGGLKNVQTGHIYKIKTPEGCIKGGYIGGPIGGRATNATTNGRKGNGGRVCGRTNATTEGRAGNGARKRNALYGSALTLEGRIKGRHTRWHTNRGVLNPEICTFCHMLVDLQTSDVLGAN